MIVNEKVLVNVILSKEDKEVIKAAANTLGLIFNGHNPTDILVGIDSEVCTLQDLNDVIGELMRIVNQLYVAE